MALKTFHRILLEKHLRELAPQIKGDILDAGAGSRRYDQLFGGQITACDLNPKPELKVERCDISALPYASDSFNNVLCLEVFQYLKIEQVEKAILEMKRVLRPGGHALLTTPFYYKAHQDNLRFSLGYLQGLLAKAGFAEVEVRKIGNKYTACYDILRYCFFEARFLRPFYLLKMVLVFLAIKVFRKEQEQDDFYTGLFAVVRK